MAGDSNKTVSTPFELTGPPNEALLIAILAICGYDLQRPKTAGTGMDCPGRDIALLLDPRRLRITNFDEVNRSVKHEYRPGWGLGA